MSLNTAHASNGVLIHSGEYILLFSDNVTMEFIGQDDQVFKGSKTGRIYLTSHRMIFNAKSQSEPMQSFSFPFVTVHDVELEQPVFGSNYIKGKVRAQPNGNWIGEAKFKLYFKSGGAIDFGQALLRAAKTAQSNMHSDAPPPYTPPSGNWHEAPQPAYQPPPGYYGWLPNTEAFSTGPPPNSVFMSDNPPPYPGIGTPQGNQGYPGAPQQAGFQGYPGPQPQGGFQGYPGAASQPGFQGYPGAPPQYGYPGNPLQPAASNYGFAGPQQNGYPDGQAGFGFVAPGAPPSNSSSNTTTSYNSGPSYSKEAEAAQSSQFNPVSNSGGYAPPPGMWEQPPSYNSLNNQNNPKQ